MRNLFCKRKQSVTTRVIDNAYIYKLEISNKDLKTLGGKMGVAF